MVEEIGVRSSGFQQIGKSPLPAVEGPLRTFPRKDTEVQEHDLDLIEEPFGRRIENRVPIPTAHCPICVEQSA